MPVQNKSGVLLNAVASGFGPWGAANLESRIRWLFLDLERTVTVLTPIGPIGMTEANHRPCVEFG